MFPIARDEIPPLHVLVESSVLGRTWALTSACDEHIQHVMSGYSIPEMVARLLVARAVPFDKVTHFLNPQLKQSMPDPSHMLDMDRGAERLYQAIVTGEKITLWGDYDVDGATSTALLYRFLKTYTPHVSFYIPDRFREGYGPNAQGFQKLFEEGTQVVVTLDCGTTARDPLTYAHHQGMDVVVIDHHGVDDITQLPPAYALINPNRPDETSPLKSLAAVGLAFLFVVALHRILRERQSSGLHREDFPLLTLLDLVALGTICDVVPLVGLNRTFVRQGLKILAQTHNMGLKELVQCAGIDKANTPYHCGFVLGPRVNAGGRIGSADLGTRLLTSEDAQEVHQIAEQLNHLNAERQGIEKKILHEAMMQAQQQEDVSLLIVSGEHWHEGVIGIVAGRLKEAFHKPTLVFAWNPETQMAKGSGRSVSGFDLGQLIRHGVAEGLLATGGGHAMAGGLSLHKSQYDAFCAWARQISMPILQAMRLPPPLMVDGVLHLHALNQDVFDHFQRLEPFGSGHPTPRFMVRSAVMHHVEVVGSQHIRCRLGSASGGKETLQGMAFRALQNPLGTALLGLKRKEPFSFVGTLHQNTWKNRTTLQIYIEDAHLTA